MFGHDAEFWRDVPQAPVALLGKSPHATVDGRQLLADGPFDAPCHTAEVHCAGVEQVLRRDATQLAQQCDRERLRVDVGPRTSPAACPALTIRAMESAGTRCRSSPADPARREG